MKDAHGQEIIARKIESGFLLVAGDGVVTSFEETDPVVYPVGSDVSTHYDHPEGIALSAEDVDRCGIEYEEGG